MPNDGEALTEDYYAATLNTELYFDTKYPPSPPHANTCRPINLECDDKGKNTGIRQVAEVWVVIHNNATQMMGISPLHP